MRFLTLVLASLLIFSALISASPSDASGQGQAEETGFRISPVTAADPAITASGYFIYKIQSSTSVTGSVMLKNPGSVPLTVQLAGVDAITAQTGGSAFTTADVTPTKAGTWLKFTETSVTLPAGSVTLVSANVSHVPALVGVTSAVVKALPPVFAVIASTAASCMVSGTLLGFLSITLPVTFVLLCTL